MMISDQAGGPHARGFGLTYVTDNPSHRQRRLQTMPRHIANEKALISMVERNEVVEISANCVQHQITHRHVSALALWAASRQQTLLNQTRPTGAIVFGDLNDPESSVSKAMKNPRRYRVLEELNVRPSVAYLRRVRNRDKESKRG